MNVLTKLRVLVVDDNEDATDILAMALSHLGFVAETAYDGEAGLAKAEEFRPDVMLIDLCMPKLDGLELAREIRSRPWGQALPLIAITAWGHDRVRAEVSDAGFDGHMIKPVRIDELCTVISGILKQPVEGAPGGIGPDTSLDLPSPEPQGVPESKQDE